MNTESPSTVPRPATPFVKWAGGKRSILAAIRCLMPTEFDTYHEPFVGGGALFFALRHRPSVISDKNAKLMNAYEELRDRPNDVIAALQPMQNDRSTYYAVRARNFGVGSRAQRAAEFIFANRAGFNGLFRENRSGQFNVPFGDQRGAKICDTANLLAVSDALKNTAIVHGDFAGVLDRAAPDDFVYFDPPYVPLSASSSFTGYQAGGFSHADQVRLRDVALELRARGVRVVLSNSSAAEVISLYSAFQIQTVQARRVINSRAEGRGAIPEVLIY